MLWDLNLETSCLEEQILLASLVLNNVLNMFLDSGFLKYPSNAKLEENLSFATKGV